MILSLLLLASPLGAQVDWPRPDAALGVGIVENLGEPVPLELVFTDHDGQRSRLGDLVKGDLPLVVTPVYYGCPTLCPLTLQGVVGALKATGLRLDEDYRIVTYSIDPDDTVEAAAAKRLDLIHALGFPSGRAGWTFLVGDEANSRELSRALGFQYKYVDAAKQWSHSAAFMVLTPDGRISRYLYGVQYPPRDVRLSLVEASGGRVGTAFDRVLLTCFRFDPNARGYQFWVKGAVRIGGLATLFALATLLTVLWRRDLHRGRATAGSGRPAVGPHVRSSEPDQEIRTRRA
jgi:protein SCO1/2